MKNSNFLGGLGLLLFGGGYLWEALRYPLGTMRNIGPGGFPLLIGLVLVAIAVFFIIQGLMQASEEFRFPWRPFIMISLSIAVFAFLVKSVGLIAAVVAAEIGRTSCREARLVSVVVASLKAMNNIYA